MPRDGHACGNCHHDGGSLASVGRLASEPDRQLVRVVIYRGMPCCFGTCQITTLELAAVDPSSLTGALTAPNVTARTISAPCATKPPVASAAALLVKGSPVVLGSLYDVAAGNHAAFDNKTRTEPCRIRPAKPYAGRMGSEQVRRHSHSRARSAPESGVSRGPRA